MITEIAQQSQNIVLMKTVSKAKIYVLELCSN